MQAQLREKELQRQREEARQLKFLPLVIKPPEGYYISGEDYQRYKQEAIEYNRKIREYRAELGKAWLAAKENRISIEQYNRLFKDRMVELDRQKPQRAAFNEYVQSIGPPKPTEQQRARQEAGLPQRGLPGPAAGPAPGSPGEQVQIGIKQVLATSERVPRAITDPLRETALRLEALSHEALRTQKPYQPPSTQFGTEPRFDMTGRLMVEKKAQPAVGALAYGYSVGFDVAAGAFDVATFPSRPGLMVETSKGLVALGVDREAKKAFAKKLSMDPFRFVAVTIGSTLIGAPEILPELKKLLSQPVKAPLSLKVLKAQRGETFEGMYGTSVKKSSYGDFFKEYKLAKLVKKIDIDEAALTQFERELGLQFPEETIKPQASEITEATFDFKDQTPDTWAPRQVTKATESYYALSGEPMGSQFLVRGKAGMKAFKETPVPPMPRSDQIMAPLSTKTVTTVTEAVPRYIPIQFAEEFIEYLPGVDLRSALATAPSVSIPNLFPTLPISALSTITGVTSTQRQEIKQTQAQTQRQAQKIADLTMPKMGNILSPKSVQTLSQPQVQIPWMEQKPVQVPKQIQFTVPKMVQIQTPAPSIPKFAVPNIPLNPFKPSPPIRVRAEPSKKKKKKSKKKRKTAYEKRKDPLRITFPNVKMPKFKVPKI